MVGWASKLKQEKLSINILCSPKLKSTRPKAIAVKTIVFHNVLPQVETLVQARRSNLSNKCLVIEGSALYPSLVRDLVTLEDVKGIWLAGNYNLLKNRIYQSSNFARVGKEEQYLIYKFLERTWLYNQAMLNESRNLGFTCIHVN